MVIECDANKLADDGLNLGTAFGTLVKDLFPRKRIAVVRSATEADLGADLAKAFEEYGRFRSILIVEHSNASGLVLSGDGLRTWSTVGSWLAMFEPEFLFLAACEAGRSDGVRDVFRKVGSLRQVYGSPVTLYKIHTAPIGVLIYLLLANGRINPEQSQAIRIAHYVLTGGQLFRWKRRDTGPGEELTGRLWDVFGTSFDFGPWDLLERLFPTRSV